MKKSKKLKTALLLTTALGLMLSAASLSLGSQTHEVEIIACDDAEIQLNSPLNFGAKNNMGVGTWSNLWWRSYVRFDLDSAIPPDAVIVSASVHLSQAAIFGTGNFTVNAHHVYSHNWDEDMIVYPGPPFNPTPSSGILDPFNVYNQVYEWPVTSDVINDFAVGDYTSFVFKRSSETGANKVFFHSKESIFPGCTKPTLRVQYTIPYLKVPGSYASIQAAIDASVNGDEVIVSPGTYYENIDFKSKRITVRSDLDGDGETYDISPETTVIDGGQAGHVVTMDTNENSDSVIDGFTITNGKAGVGGGIYCYLTDPTIRNNIITLNTSTGSSGGGGIYCDDADAQIEGNRILANTTAVAGGGILILGCHIEIKNNVIAWNSAEDGGGICASSSDGVLENNMIVHNVATRGGGGVSLGYTSIATVMNNTITANTAKDGGGLYCAYGSDAQVTNTIIWGNMATASDPEIRLYSATPVFSWCAIKGGYTGTGIIDEYPRFEDPSGEDYSLSWRSPCINRGTATGAPAGDIDGDARPNMGSVDMGADEFTGTHALAADSFAFLASTGGTVNFDLDARPENGGRYYIVLGTMSGTVPGTALPQGLAVLPINWDAFTELVLSLINTPVFWNFLNVLDAQGRNTAQLNAPILSPMYVGLTMHYAFTVNNPFDFASNAVEVVIQ